MTKEESLLKSKNFKDFKDFIYDVVNVLRWELMINQHTVTTSVVTNKKDIKGDIPNLSVAAEIHVNELYLSAHVTVYPLMFEYYKEGDYRSVVKILCHELCHILVDPLFFEAWNTGIFFYKPDEEKEDWQETQETAFGVFNRILKKKRENLVEHMANITMIAIDNKPETVKRLKL